MSNMFKRFVTEDEGADATEYALVIGLVALGIVAGATVLGKALSGAFNTIGNTVTTDVP